jgi:hypothetical protein
MGFSDFEHFSLTQTMTHFCHTRNCSTPCNVSHIQFRIEEYSLFITQAALAIDSAQPQYWEDFVKITFDKESKLWFLQWLDEHGVWQDYYPLFKSPEIKRLLDEVTRDPQGLFW